MAGLSAQIAQLQQGVRVDNLLGSKLLEDEKARALLRASRTISRSSWRNRT